MFVKDAYEVERSIASERKTIWEVVVSVWLAFGAFVFLLFRIRDLRVSLSYDYLSHRPPSGFICWILLFVE